jgi:sialate O-acetylesterase
MGLLAAARCQAADPPLMDALFTDHAVLQRDRPIPVWGRAQPGEEVTVTLSGATKRVHADAEGRWSVDMPEQPASGPHTLTARTATRMQNAHDVLVGDVWLCSGQSNMEFSVRGSLNARAEIAASADDAIRQVKVPRGSSLVPRAGFDAPLEWKVAGPETTGDFSATCYYFARELKKTANVPMGLVVSAWGGSKIQPWMSAQALRDLGGYDTALRIGEEYRTGVTTGSSGGAPSPRHRDASPGRRRAAMPRSGAPRPPSSPTGRAGACRSSRISTAWSGTART